MPSIQLDPSGGPEKHKPPVREQVPPPAKLPPGVTGGNPPLPIGKAVRVASPRLTAFERQKLGLIGWQEGMPIPPDAADQIAAAEEAMRQTTEGPLPPPVDPTTPPISLKTIDVGDLPPAKQEQVHRELAQALSAGTAGRPTPKETSPIREQLKTRGQAVEEAVPPAPAVAQKVMQAKPIAMEAEQPRRPATRTSIDPEYEPPPPAAVPEPGASGDLDKIADVGATAPLQFCPHCGWDLSIPEIVEPSHDEKMTFLASMLGGQTFSKTFNLLGGQLVIELRTLTTQEIDEIYRQAFRDRENGVIGTDAEFWERVNRMRLYLQLLAFRSTTRNRDMPNGFTPESNPNAHSFWEFPADTLRDQKLPAVEKWLLTNVLTNESINRVLQIHCNRFNRLVSRLEAMVDNADFWKATGQLS